MLRPRDAHLLPLPCFCGVATQEAADSSDCLPPWQGFQFGPLISGHRVLNGLTQPGCSALLCSAPAPRYKFVL